MGGEQDWVHGLDALDEMQAAEPRCTRSPSMARLLMLPAHIAGEPGMLFNSIRQLFLFNNHCREQWITVVSMTTPTCGETQTFNFCQIQGQRCRILREVLGGGHPHIMKGKKEIRRLWWKKWGGFYPFLSSRPQHVQQCCVYLSWAVLAADASSLFPSLLLSVADSLIYGHNQRTFTTTQHSTVIKSAAGLHPWTRVVFVQCNQLIVSTLSDYTFNGSSAGLP